MIKSVKYIGISILSGLFLSFIIIASVSVFDKELSDNYERYSQTYTNSEIFDNNIDAVLTDAFLYNADFNLYFKDKGDRQYNSRKKYFLLNSNTKIITAYNRICKTRINLRPILYSGLKIYMNSYHTYEEYPSIS